MELFYQYEKRRTWDRGVNMNPDLEKCYDYIRDIIDYLETHASDMRGMELYNTAKELLGDITVDLIDRPGR
jgi:hypothetical protein